MSQASIGLVEWFPVIYAIVAIGTFWSYFAWQPGAPREWIIPEAAVVLTLLLANAVVGRRCSTQRWPSIVR